MAPSASASMALNDAETALIAALGCSAPYEKRAIEVDGGHAINTLSAGAVGGTPLVVVHGWGSGVAFYGKNVEALGRERRVHFVDMLGFGASSRPPFPRSGPPEKAIDFFVGALLAWMDAMEALEGAATFHVVGHSLGAYLCTQLARRAPARVRSLTLASPVGVPHATSAQTAPGLLWKVVRWVVWRLWELRVTPQWVIRIAGPWLGRVLARALTRPRFAGAPALQHKVGEYFYQISAAPPSGEYSLHTVLKPGVWAQRPLVDVLPAIRCPTAFLYGDRDWMDASVARSVAPRMKDAKVLVVADSGHHVYYDNPDEFNRVVLEMSKS